MPRKKKKGWGLTSGPRYPTTPPNGPEWELGMADEQEIVTQAVAVVREMPSYRNHTTPKCSEDQPQELRSSKSL